MDGVSASATPSRKRHRENETESQRIKREKAAERQRRKRERDRNNAAAGAAAAAAAAAAASMPFMPPPPPPPPQAMPPPTATQMHHHTHHVLPHEFAVPVGVHTVQPAQVSISGSSALSPEEEKRRERVRAAARERQRKHRHMVKQRKLRELGLEMGNEVVNSGIDYRVGSDGHYDLTQDPTFAQPVVNAGQTFATTLLLSCASAPLLKQHILRTLYMSNEELASLEPVIADAFEQWDRQHKLPSSRNLTYVLLQRRMHYEAIHGVPMPPPSTANPYPLPLPHESGPMGPTSSGSVPPPPPPHPNGASLPPLPPPPPNMSPLPPTSTSAFGVPPDVDQANEFRARFHRTLFAQPPFRPYSPPPPFAPPPSDPQQMAQLTINPSQTTHNPGQSSGQPPHTVSPSQTTHTPMQAREIARPSQPQRASNGDIVLPAGVVSSNGGVDGSLGGNIGGNPNDQPPTQSSPHLNGSS
ncbi:hypothetical protein FISHEDRAFT_58532 [Fistulina hepatica ATCC 64428]|uniref:Uncharacterized protein n=1 Tax=Fistulina hepatica ATCC 64428 TaxID=1128425 RepID=A0A0D7ADI2_9AGAR|nr:hypothetical protein FISHEDRAFT_58532 [Fistulina hepatica ATCC 64428]